MAADCDQKQTLNDDWPKLVELFLNPDAPEHLRNNAAKRLQCVAEVITRRTLSALGIGYKEILVEDAVEHIMLQILRGKFDARKGNFVGWCKKVCRNYLSDQRKRSSRTITKTDLLASRRTSNGNEGREDDSFWEKIIGAPDYSCKITSFQEAFCQEDLEKVRTWKPLRDRVIVLTWSGLWVKVPDLEWKEWTQELGLPWLFPPQFFVSLTELNDRARALARMFGLTRNHLSVLWRRRKPWLENLRCIQELREGTPDEDL